MKECPCGSSFKSFRRCSVAAKPYTMYLNFFVGWLVTAATATQKRSHGESLECFKFNASVIIHHHHHRQHESQLRSDKTARIKSSRIESKYRKWLFVVFLKKKRKNFTKHLFNGHSFCIVHTYCARRRRVRGLFSVLQAS